jgi:hypothetical protein
MSNTRVRAMLLAAAVCLGPAIAMGQPVQFNDGEFLPAGWTQFRYFGGRDAIGGVFATDRIPAGGAPAAYRQVTHIWTGPGDLIVVHLRAGAVYDPAVSGGIASIDAQLDAAFTPVTVPFWVGCGVALLQGAQLYVHNHVATSPNWTRFGGFGLRAEDFSDYYEPGLHPDFSAGGEPIRVGYYTSNGVDCACGRTTALGVDNWSVAIHPEGATCRVDLSGDGLVDFSDFLEFLNLFDAGDERVDFNEDGIIDFGDYLEFLNLFEVGC